MPSAPKRSDGPFCPDGARLRRLRHDEYVAAILAGIVAVSGLLGFFLFPSMELEAGSQPERIGTQAADPPVAAGDPTLGAVERILRPINGELQDFKAWFHNAWHLAIVGPADKT